jgi:formate hydrogenlyase transcriptional activator
LFYRLSVFPLAIPSLRERREDIPLLASHFVKQACTRMHLPESKLPHREMARLQDYDWPGNVRELQNVVERALILAQRGPLQFDLQGSRNHKAAPADEDRSEFFTEAEWRDRERVNLIHALKHAGGKVSGAGGAAELLGVNPNTLASRLRALGISRRYSV